LICYWNVDQYRGKGFEWLERGKRWQLWTAIFPAGFRSKSDGDGRDEVDKKHFPIRVTRLDRSNAFLQTRWKVSFQSYLSSTLFPSSISPLYNEFEGFNNLVVECHNQIAQSPNWMVNWRVSRWKSQHLNGRRGLDQRLPDKGCWFQNQECVSHNSGRQLPLSEGKFAVGNDDHRDLADLLRWSVELCSATGRFEWNHLLLRFRSVDLQVVLMKEIRMNMTINFPCESSTLRQQSSNSIWWWKFENRWHDNRNLLEDL
jgi:hypothetical protein